MDGVEKTVPAQEDQYDSEEDEDFNPTTVEADNEELSESSEEEEPSENAPTKSRKPAKKRKQAPPELNEDLDSGDEATIREVKKKKRKGNDDEDSGGEGGLVKTRAQRAAEYEDGRKICRKRTTS